MNHDPEKHGRHSIRLKDYDYSQEGAYFVTICTKNRECILGEIINGEVHLTQIGTIVRDQWIRSAEIRDEILVDVFVIMPNHLHGVVFILDDSVGATGGRPLPQKTATCSPSRIVTPADANAAIVKGPRKYSLASFIAGYKSGCTKSINESLGTKGMAIWQRNYYEHIIRNEKSLNAIREYILMNPERWMDDPENPALFGPGL